MASANKENPSQQVASYGDSGPSYPPPYNDSRLMYQNNGQNVGGVTVMTAYQANNPNVVIVTQQRAPVQYVQVKQFNFGHYYFWSCMVFWLCGFLFGGIAFILAVIGSHHQLEGDSAGARRLAHASLAFIIIGVVIGCAAWSVLIWWLADCTWTVYGTCVVYYY